MTTYIIGAGPTGMAIVDGLIDDATEDIVLIEQGNNLGGLAQTLEWAGIGFHDLGPHKIFSLDQSITKRVENLLASDQWLTRDKVSSIFINGHFLPYPPSPFSLAGVFGLRAFIRMVIGYGLVKFNLRLRSNDAKTFEDDLKSRVGGPLYEILFKPIALKLWGDPRELDVKLSKGRVQTPSIIEVLGRVLGVKKNTEFEALKFRYPKTGLTALWQAIFIKAASKTKFLVNHSLLKIEVNNDLISQIVLGHLGQETIIKILPTDHVVSTLPMSKLGTIFQNGLTPEFKNLAEQVLTLNDLILVFFHVDIESLLKESWVFVPDSEIIFHRISEQESFDPEMTPNGSIVCCELMSSKERMLTEKSDEELTKLSLEGIQLMGYEKFKMLNSRVIRLPKSYPVFNKGYEPGLKQLVSELDKFKNFKSIGRQGAFNYIGTLDAMDIGYGYSKWLSNGMIASWENERDRTNHYPVLD